MDPHLLALYEALGVPLSSVPRGPEDPAALPSIAPEPTPPADAALFQATPTEAPPRDLAAPCETVTPRPRAPRPPDPAHAAPGSADLPPLDLPAVEALHQLFRERPDELLARARLAFDKKMTHADLARSLDAVRTALTAPRQASAVVASSRALATAAHALPDTFDFDGMDLAEIDIDPGNTRFETWGDAWGWVVNTGGFLFGYPAGPKAGFRYHDDPRYLSRFVYPLEGQAAGASLSVALFSDFGTGLYHSRYIAKQLRTLRFPYAIHLGDVYYAGRQAEFDAYFARYLDPLLDHTRVFTMNGNHEMFSRGVPYFRYLDARRAHPLQQQEGSYFCLRGATAQIIGIDTDYFGAGRFADPSLLTWLDAQLSYGRAHGLTNILLSGDEPYEYGSTGRTSLYQDLRRLVSTRHLVDLWFWGNTHYCALFGPAGDAPFIGSCIGHGGYPYERQVAGKDEPAPVEFLEKKGRFPDWTRLRPDRGNNGYCVLTFQPGGDLGLRYVDWMSHDRCLVSLARAGDGKLSLGSVTEY
jgi:hypothetical protein